MALELGEERRRLKAIGDDAGRNTDGFRIPEKRLADRRLRDGDDVGSVLLIDGYPAVPDRAGALQDRFGGWSSGCHNVHRHRCTDKKH